MRGDRHGGTVRGDDRGQSVTLEAVTGALVMAGAIIFALQATALTPLTASTANQQIEEQNRAMADDVLNVGAENGTLVETLLYYDTAEDAFYGANRFEGVYTTGGPPTAFGRLLILSDKSP